MRFGLVIYGSLDNSSGGYLYDRQLVEHLRSVGHEVEIIEFSRGSYLRHLSDNVSKRNFRGLLNFDVDILLQDELNHPSLFALNRRLKARRSLSIVSIVHHLRANERHPLFLRSFYAGIEQSYLNGVDGFIFNSHTTKKSVERLLSRGRAHVVARPAGDRLKPIISPEEIEKRAKSTGPLRVVFVGNLIRRKAAHLVVEAMSRLEPGTIRLSIAGSMEGERNYVRRIKALAASHDLDEQVRFLGHLDEESLAMLLQQSQVLAVPSDYEGYGIVYLEGMGFGLPAIGTQAGAAGEIITDGKDGYLIEPGDAEQLAKQLGDLHSHRRLLLEMSSAALERFRKHPSWQQSMARAANFLETYIIDNKPRSTAGG